MADYVLSCSSTADLSREHLSGRGIPFVCFHYFLDGKEYPDDIGETIPFHEFYRRMSEGAMTKTSQISVGEYTAYFEKFLKEGKDVIHATLSSGISGTYQSAMLAAEDLKEKYPDRKLYVVDSLCASSGYGLLVDRMADQRDAGMSIEDLYAWAEENKHKCFHWFFSSDLTFFIRGGRISKTAGYLGQMFRICPLMDVRPDGTLDVREKIRTKKKVIKAIVEKMEQQAAGGLDYSGKCFISNSDCYEDARAVADLIEERFKKLDGPVKIYSIGNLIGAHTGPGTVALFFWSDKNRE